MQCVPLGPGYTTSADSTGAEMMKIIQTPGLIVILNPDLTYRQIFLDGRALESAPNPSWMGYSVGRWDGDTLVVESFGFNDRTWLDHDGHPHTEALRMTERYRRRDFGNLDLEVTLSDPAAYARPWTVAVRAELAADTEMIEWVCNENNHARWSTGSARRRMSGKARSRSPPRFLRSTSAPMRSRPRSGERSRESSRSRSRMAGFSPTWTAEGRFR